MDAGEGLGAAGMWNFLWRLGIHAAHCTVDRLPNPQESILWAHLEEGTNAQQVLPLQRWMAGGGYVVASGDAVAWATALGWDPARWTTLRPENPYAGIAWQLPGRSAELIAPARWSIGLCRTAPPGAEFIGRVATVQGERQTPARALVNALEGPAIVRGNSYCFLNGRPFAAFQSWLQGQESLQTWIGWRPRLFWLDEWVSSIADVLLSLSALPPELRRPGIPGLGPVTVILRHDVDHSRDVTYLDEEVRRQLPGTHAILRDANTGFWIDRVAAHRQQESAFHYNTARRAWLREARGRLRGLRSGVVEPMRSAVTARGLLRQVQWAKRRGIGVASLHRHMSFLIYPEWIDALDATFREIPEVLGASSLFRAQVLRWGEDTEQAGASADWPDAQFPLWLPFKVAQAADGGRLLRGWETTSVMESEPDLVGQLLSHKLAHISQRVVTLGYHPAHARGKTFHATGSADSFAAVLDVIATHGADVTSARDVFAAATAALGASPGSA